MSMAYPNTTKQKMSTGPLSTSVKRVDGKFDLPKMTVIKHGSLLNSPKLDSITPWLRTHMFVTVAAYT